MIEVVHEGQTYQIDTDDPAAATAAVRKHLGMVDQMPTGLGRTAAMAGSNAAEGALGTLSLPMTMLQGAYNAIGKNITTPAINLARSAMGSEPVEYPPVTMPGSTGPLLGSATAAGIIRRPDLVPQNKGEEYLAASSRGLGGAAPLAAVNPAAAVSTLASGFAGGAGAQAGKDLVEASPYKDNPYVKAGAEFTGAVAGGYAGGKLADVTARAVNSIFNPGPTIRAYQDVGVTPRLAGDVSENKTLQALQTYSAKAPGAASRTGRAAEDTLDEFAAAVEKQANMLGTSRTQQQSGEALQRGAQDWLKQWKTDSKSAWESFWLSVNPNIKSKLTETRTIIGNSATALEKEAPDLAKALQDPTMGKYAELMRNNPQSLSGPALREFRSAIGDKIANAPLVGDENVASLKRLYGALTNDLRTLAATSGNDSVALFDRANAVTRDGHALIESTVGNIIGEGGRKVAPELAAKWAMGTVNEGGSRLASVRQAAGDRGVNELASSELRASAASLPGQQTADLNAVSPPRLLTEIAKLSPEARSELYRDADKLGSLLKVGGTMRETQKLTNTSNTAPTSQLGSILEKLILFPMLGAGAGATAGGRGSAAGAGAGLLAATAQPVANNIAGRIATSPTVSRFAAAPGLGAQADQIPLAALLLARDPELRGLLESSLIRREQTR